MKGGMTGSGAVVAASSWETWQIILIFASLWVALEVIRRLRFGCSFDNGFKGEFIYRPPQGPWMAERLLERFATRDRERDRDIEKGAMGDKGSLGD